MCFMILFSVKTRRHLGQAKATFILVAGRGVEPRSTGLWALAKRRPSPQRNNITLASPFGACTCGSISAKLTLVRLGNATTIGWPPGQMKRKEICHGNPNRLGQELDGLSRGPPQHPPLLQVAQLGRGHPRGDSDQILRKPGLDPGLSDPLSELGTVCFFCSKTIHSYHCR